MSKSRNFHRSEFDDDRWFDEDLRNDRSKTNKFKQRQNDRWGKKTDYEILEEQAYGKSGKLRT